MSPIKRQESSGGPGRRAVIKSVLHRFNGMDEAAARRRGGGVTADIVRPSTVRRTTMPAEMWPAPLLSPLEAPQKLYSLSISCSFDIRFVGLFGF